MKMPLHWIKEYTDITLQPQELAERISVSLAEVEKVEEVESELVLEIENKALTHRPDCFSVEGFSREISAITGTTFTPSLAPSFPSKAGNKPLSVEIADFDLCRRYTAVVIDNLVIKPSSEEMQKKLRLSGIRPINNLVDITNYVMLKTGQPLHAFDYDSLSSDKRILIRKAAEKEKITTLDDQERTLDANMLVIADSEKAIALAGIMGGSNTEVTEKTKTIVLESANFEHFNNRYTSLHLGLRTEASLRFEKGQDPNNTLNALTEAVDLYSKHASGIRVSDVIDVYPTPTLPTTVPFRPSHISRRLGTPLKEDQITAVLCSLFFECIKIGDDTWNAVIPTFRRDIQMEADLLEEVARIYGYDRIPPSLPKRTLEPAPINSESMKIRSVKNTLIMQGLDEINTYTFTNPQTYAAMGLSLDRAIRIKNPISPELSLIRPSLIPSVLEKVALNSTSFREFSLFEINKGIEKSPSDLPSEHKKLVAVSYSDSVDTFFTLKGIIEVLLSEQGIESFEFQPIEASSLFKSGHIAEIRIADISIGSIGTISSEILKYLSLSGYVALVEIDIEELIANSPFTKRYTPIPRYPETTFDLSFIIPQTTPIGSLINQIKTEGYRYLHHVELFDIFTTQKLGADKKSVAFHLTFSSPEKTLAIEEIREEVGKIETFLISKYSAVIRKEGQL